VEAPGVRFGILGPLRVWRAGVELELGPPQEQLVLATLLARAGDWVSVDELVGVLWPTEPPDSAVNVLHRHVGRLRRLLEPGLPARATGRWLVRRGSGYQLKVDLASADLLVFRDLVARAETNDDVEAVETYGQAFRLWRGPCADGLAQVDTTFTAINNECTDAAVTMAEAALRHHRAADILPVLRRMTPTNPLNERLHARFMLVLAATGHQAEALAVYRTMSERLAEDLGIDPGPDLRSAHAQVLGQDQPEPHQPVPRPAQLPMDLPKFGGRRVELAKLRAALDTPMRIAAIDGMPGSGKTTLAIHFAHSIVRDYPDGQLYVNLRGFDPSGLAVEPSTALVGFLTALNVPGDQVPSDVAAQSALYRTHLADKRMLVVLDNVRDAEQVLPLLPGSATCLVIMTSRNRLVGLVATEGARPFTLDPVPGDDAREILTLRLGALRGREGPAVEQIVRVCRGLPLALAIVAARAETYPDVSLSAIAAELVSGLDALSHDETRGVRAVFSWSYEALRPEAARLFRLLSYHWGPDISSAACASLLGTPVRESRAALAELSRTRLVTEHVPGRFLLHDLVRAYGMELSQDLDTREDRTAAVRRMLDHYLQSAHAANILLHAHQVTELPPVRPGVTPERPNDFGAATRWLSADYRVLTMAVDQAVELGDTRTAWQLALALQSYQHHHALLQDWAKLQRFALTAARNAGDTLGQVRTERSLAGAYFMLGDGETALRHLRNTKRVVDELGMPAESAYLERNLGEVLSGNSPDVPADHKAAIGHYDRAIELYEEMGHRQGVAYALEGLARSRSILGDHETAVALLRRALDLHQQIGEPVGEGYVYAELASIDLRLGRLDEAEALLAKAIELHIHGQHRLMQVDDLMLLGDVRKARGDLPAARSAWEESLAVATESGAMGKASELQERLDRSDRDQAAS
jgi:DNA-binding SARP family transcriptional activator/tetratricopeptide (TPR) repeat protein